MPKRKRFQMSANKGHTHSVLLDDAGNGTSSKNSGHVHEVRSRRVLVGGKVKHKHTLIGG